MFIDYAKIYVRGGAGGNGCNSLYRDKYTRYPKRDGGDGGNGGNVIVRADKNVWTLYDFKFRKHFMAKAGMHGSSNKKRGRDAEDLVIRVPLGTIISDASTGSKLRELLDNGQEVIASRGGDGGKGNVHTRDEQKFRGVTGEEKDIILDLKLIADVGLIGYPNSGKSTLISSITSAHPQIASFPFTTKSPVLGIVDSQNQPFSVADIPGLIEGSHEGRGLGDKFLRHVERTKVLVHLVDMAGVDGREPFGDYQIISKELKFYSAELVKKPKILVANKMDLPRAQENLKNFKKKFRGKILLISALEKKGLEELCCAIREKL